MSAPVLKLGSEFTIAYAAANRELLLQAMSEPGDGLTLDLSAVSEFDSAGVQLLLATANSLQELGQQLRISAASAPVQEGLAVFGLQGLLAPEATTH
jgi:anti-sigma B factor antagonist